MAEGNPSQLWGVARENSETGTSDGEVAGRKQPEVVAGGSSRSHWRGTFHSSIELLVKHAHQTGKCEWICWPEIGGGLTSRRSKKSNVEALRTETPYAENSNAYVSVVQRH